MPHPPNRLNVVRAVRGQTKELELTVRTKEGRIPPLNGKTIFMTAKANITDEASLFVKSTGDGVQVVDASKGKVKITLSSSDTDLAPGTYKYDIWLSDNGDPPVRKPIVKSSDLVIQSGVSSFS